MVKSAFTHSNQKKRIRPVNEVTYERDEAELQREQERVEQAPAETPVMEKSQVQETPVQTQVTPAAPVDPVQQVQPQPVQQTQVKPSPSDTFFNPTTPVQPVQPTVQEPQSQPVEQPVAQAPVQDEPTVKTLPDTAVRQPAPGFAEGTEIVHGQVGSGLPMPATEEDAFIREDQLPRRIAGRCDEETFRALRILAMDLDKPTWLIMATILRDALVENRPFDGSHVPKYRKNRFTGPRY